MRLQTKAQREAVQQATIENLVSKYGYQLNEYKDLKILTSNKNNTYYLQVYKASAAHPINNVAYRTNEEVIKAIENVKKSYERNIEWKAEQKIKNKGHQSNHAAAAAAIREELKEKFSGVKFSVKSEGLDIYLDFVNNFITIAKMAEHYQMDEIQMDKIIEEGRIAYCDSISNTGKFKVKFLTQKGILEMIIPKETNLEELGKEIQKEHGDFTTLSSEPVIDTESQSIESIYELLHSDEHQKAVETFDKLTGREKFKLFSHANFVDGDFSNASDWNDGIPPTLEESKENILILVEDIRKTIVQKEIKSKI